MKNIKSDEDDPFKLRSVFSDKIGETIKLFESSFSAKITDEAGKININECYKGRCEELLQMLTALFSCPAENAFLESKNIKPVELAYRIRDFISEANGTSPESGLSDKNSPYQEQVPPYSTKGLPFDTIAELKLVAGWDDDLHAVFAPYLTVYPYPVANTQLKAPININAIKPELLSCLVPDARSPSCAESFALKMNKIKKDNTPVFATSIKNTLTTLACYNSQPSTSGGPTINPETWFDQKSNVFRIEVEAITGDQDRKLIAVVRRIMPQEKTNGRDQQNMKRSYQILHWKLL